MGCRHLKSVVVKTFLMCSWASYFHLYRYPSTISICLNKKYSLSMIWFCCKPGSNNNILVMQLRFCFLNIIKILFLIQRMFSGNFLEPCFDVKQFIISIVLYRTFQNMSNQFNRPINVKIIQCLRTGIKVAALYI